MVEQLITSFIASGAFGILFNAPKTALIKCGFVGMVGWIIYTWLVELRFDLVISTFIASFFVAIINSSLLEDIKLRLLSLV
jgi:uncharacterized membrane protein YjjB (DUF3815 family)